MVQKPGSKIIPESKSKSSSGLKSILKGVVKIVNKKKGLSEKNKKIIKRVYVQIKIINYLRKPKKTKNKMKKALMKLGLYRINKIY
jgi:hypothetical protein